MAKDTVLGIVQGILSDADGDEVNSISDTIEATQCAQIVKDCFEQIVDGYDLAHHKTIKRLEATTSSTPMVMTRPEGFYSIEWIQYDKRVAASDPQNYLPVIYMEPEEFIKRVSARSTDESNVTGYTLTGSSHVLPIVTNQAPSYWTILEGYDRIVFDSYDSDLETNLQQSKSLAYGVQKPTLTLADATIPDLPKDLIHLLKREARALYFDLYKDGVTREVDRTRRRAEVRAQRLRHITKLNAHNQTGPNYGRK